MLSKELNEVKEKIKLMADAGNAHAKQLVSILEKSDDQMQRVFLENIAPMISIAAAVAENYHGTEFAEDLMRRKNVKN